MFVISATTGEPWENALFFQYFSIGALAHMYFGTDEYTFDSLTHVRYKWSLTCRVRRLILGTKSTT